MPKKEKLVLSIENLNLEEFLTKIANMSVVASKKVKKQENKNSKKPI